MTTSNADARRWAREQGLDVPARGPLPDVMLAQYEAAQDERLAAIAASVPGPRPAPGELEDGDEDLQVSDEYAGTSVAGPPPAAGMAERRPRSVKAPGTRQRLARLAGAKDSKAKRKPKAKHPRVPVDKAIEGGWQLLAGLARPLPATSRLLTMQAPVAGIMLEERVRNTAIDRLLQPVARAEAAGKDVFALIVPPLAITALQLNPDAAPFLLPVLRQSLLVWCEVAGPRMEQAMKRESEFASQYGQTVDTMIEWLLGQPAEAAAAPAEDTPAA